MFEDFGFEFLGFEYVSVLSFEEFKVLLLSIVVLIIVVGVDEFVFE